MIKPQLHKQFLPTFALLFLAFTTPAYTQTTGVIEGYVYDGSSKSKQPAVLKGVKVKIKHKETGLERNILTDKSGHFRFENLKIGKYLISVEFGGWEPKPVGTPGEIRVDLRPPVQLEPPHISLQKSRGTSQQETQTVWLRPLGSSREVELVLQPISWAATVDDKAYPQSSAQSAASQAIPSSDPPASQLVNTLNATRGGLLDDLSLQSLPLPGIRTIESLALTLPGIVPPPEALGNAVGPGIGAGIGTAGQFSVNGQRARSNNFTLDGSDNNDEDIGVRRQGFLALIPQSIESIQEFYIATQLWEAWEGRNSGSQVDLISKSGINKLHGTFYDLFNHRVLNARNFFDYTTNPVQPTRTLMAKLPPGVTVGGQTDVPVMINGEKVVQKNPSGGKDQYLRNQGGASIGFPIIRDKTFFFGSFERQDIKAQQETHFSVPTVAQRGFLGFGATGFEFGRRQRVFQPTLFAGDSVFSLFPFPNNPVGPYSENTFTQVLPTDATGTIFSLRLDHSFKLFGPGVDHILSGRYNFTHDRREVPAVGNALFSSAEPHIRTQNLSLILDSHLTEDVANQLRGSYGRTRLRFDTIPNPLTSQLVPDKDRFLASSLVSGEVALLNRRVLQADAKPTVQSSWATYTLAKSETESGLGTVGQLLVTPFSLVGLDVYLFPQGRTNNTYQIADTVTVFLHDLQGNHTFKFGADIRRTQLNSFLDRNFRPQVVFSGVPDLTSNILLAPFPNLSRFGPTPGFFSGSDLAALGLPSDIFQSLSISHDPDSTIGLRFWQHNFFFNDNWTLRRGLSLDLGLRYEYNTVPREVNNRIESRFLLDPLDLLPAADPSLLIRPNTASSTTALPTTAFLQNSINASLAALKTLIGGRKSIYDPDRNNFGPHIGIAWDPFTNSTAQAGKTAVRGGIGIYYDTALGSVVSQSRNVFPTFVSFDVNANTLNYIGSIFGTIPSPSLLKFDISSGSQQAISYNLIQQGKLNVVGVPSGAIQALFGLFNNVTGPAAGSLNSLPPGSGLAFTLPDRHLRSPYSIQFNLQVERELFRKYLVNVAYVGSRGLKLTRIRTPNGGPNSPTIPVDLFGETLGDVNLARIIALPPLSNIADLGTQRASRPISALGAFTVFDSSASSSYHSLQVSVNRRISEKLLVTGAYTWSHAIDNVSDVFDLAGAFNLPQDDRDLKAERGDANFDIRHRFVLSLVSDIPFSRRFNNARGVKRLLLGGWQTASISTYQTGQPFTVNTSFDINLDGNLTDRLNTTNGIVVTDNGPQKLTLTVPATSLLASVGQNGQVGRNTFRASGVAKTDFTLIKNFRVRQDHSLALRIEAFNVWNRTHFGIPVRIIDAPSFGRAVKTSLDSRQVQFALKYVF